MAEDGFHEIQLNSKQLVFLFMATAVVAAVIFLSGVMVGRGVRAEKEPLEAAGTLAAQAAESPVGGGGTQAPPASAIPAAPPSGQSQAASDELSYYNRLGAAGSPKETLKPASPIPAPPAAGLQTKPAAAPPPTPAKPTAQPSGSAPKSSPPQESKPPLAAAAKAPAAAKTAANVPAEPPKADTARSVEPAGSVFSVQVSALRSRAGADAVVKELSAKGYDAYVVGPQGASSLYRVRVGKYKDRRDAEELKRRLEKENYKPLITR
jgi:cell division septation protein DedD